MPENFVKVFDRRAVHKSHGIHVSKTNRTILITQVGNIYSYCAGLSVVVMVAGATIHGAGWHRRLMIIGDFSFPAPLPGILGD
jgi:hypothetical protein